MRLNQSEADLSTPSNDPALQRRREQSARRNRTYYERQLQARCWRGPLPLKMQQRRYWRSWVSGSLAQDRIDAQRMIITRYMTLMIT